MAAALPRSAAKPGVNPLLVAVLVSFGTLFEALNSTALSVALNTVAGNLGATAEESDGIITGYLVANAAVMPLSGWAGDSYVTWEQDDGSCTQVQVKADSDAVAAGLADDLGEFGADGGSVRVKGNVVVLERCTV